MFTVNCDASSRLNPIVEHTCTEIFNNKSYIIL